LGIGDWGLGIGPNPQSPIPNPQSPNIIIIIKILNIPNIYDLLYKIKLLKLSLSNIYIYYIYKMIHAKIILSSYLIFNSKELEKNKFALFKSNNNDSIFNLKKAI